MGKTWKFQIDLKTGEGEFSFIPTKKDIKNVEKMLGVKIMKRKKKKKVMP